MTRFGIDTLLMCLVIAMVVIAGVGAFTECAEGLCETCSHACLGVADRGRPLWRSAISAASKFVSASSIATWQVPTGLFAVVSATGSLDSSSNISKASLLRI